MITDTAPETDAGQGEVLLLDGLPLREPMPLDLTAPTVPLTQDLDGPLALDHRTSGLVGPPPQGSAVEPDYCNTLYPVNISYDGKTYISWIIIEDDP